MPSLTVTDDTLHTVWDLHFTNYDPRFWAKLLKPREGQTLSSTSVQSIRVPARAREYSRARKRAAREQAAARELRVPARAREYSRARKRAAREHAAARKLAATCTPATATNIGSDSVGRTGFVRASHRSKGIGVPARAREYSRARQRAAREQAAAWVPARSRDTPTSATSVTRGRSGSSIMAPMRLDGGRPTLPLEERGAQVRR